MSSQTAKMVLYGLISLELIFVVFHLIDALSGMPSKLIHELVYLDTENTIPSIFSSMQLMAIGLLLFCLVTESSEMKVFKSLFIMSTLVFAFLSLDEALGLHEKLQHRIGTIDWVPKNEGGHGSWTYIYFFAGVAFLLTNSVSIVKFFKKFPTQSRFIIGGMILYVTGSVVLEYFTFSLDLRREDIFALYTMEVVAEEFLEMAGVSIVLYGFLQFCTDEYRQKYAEDILDGSGTLQSLDERQYIMKDIV
jgi:hypothetical protein